MAAPTLPAGYRLIELDEIDSTNEDARRLSAAGDVGPVWIMAHAQTAGRGRRGREWSSPRGNLMATLLMPPHCAPAQAALLSFVAAVAVHDTLCRWVPPDSVRLKWPNDTLVEGRKISGILLETATAGDRRELPWLAIGIGINLVHAPALANYPATFVNECGIAPDPLAALGVLAGAWDLRFRTWQTQGFPAIRAAWLERAAGLNGMIDVRLPGETISGIFETIRHDGALELLCTDGQRRAIAAGEVFFPDALR